MGDLVGTENQVIQIIAGTLSDPEEIKSLGSETSLKRESIAALKKSYGDDFFHGLLEFPTTTVRDVAAYLKGKA